MGNNEHEHNHKHVDHVHGISIFRGLNKEGKVCWIRKTLMFCKTVIDKD